jgi:signal transduction histidine kinase
LLRPEEEKRQAAYIETMNRTYGRGVILVTVVAMVILMLLAYLQYTWVGQLSEEEFGRTQRTLRFAVFDCTMGFNRQMVALMMSLGGSIDGNDAAVSAEVHARIHRLQSTGATPMLVADSIWIAASPQPDRAAKIQLDERSSLFLLKDFSALALPIEGSPERSVHIALRRSSMAADLIPSLLEQATSLIEAYDIAILDGHQQPLYVSPGADLARLTENPDIVAPLLTLPPGPLTLLDTGVLGNRMADPSWMRREQAWRPPPREEKGQRGPVRVGGPPFDRGPGRSGLFELRLLHRSGSLEELVTSNRIRNLGIGSGVLLLLGFSILFLIRSAGRAQQLARQQLEFVAVVSHELRTPLAVLKSAGENLADGVINDRERLRQYGGLIEEEVVRLSDMVERTLAFAGIQSGKQIYDAQPVDVPALVEQVVSETRKRFPGEELSVNVSLDPALPPLKGDLHALASALENLLVNALKYSPSAKWVGVSAKPVHYRGRPFIQIIITDHGMGIPSGDLHRIFEPFYRGRNAMDGQVRGSGLGLSITKHVIEAHGGTLTVKSTINKGSMFTLLLPTASPSGNES